MLVANLHEESLVAQRQMFDGNRECGGILSINIDKSIISNSGMANIRHEESLRRRNETENT